MTGPDDSVKVLATGHFKLDRSRAMDKLAHFQLADHRQYVAELVAAAVCAGATHINVRVDADDFELEWDGAHPDLTDLDGFFDALFYRGTDPHQRMVQHLVQGVLGAVGLDPLWVRLHRPGLTLDLTDPRAPVSSENTRTEGVRVEVRKRFSLDVLLAWGIKSFSEPEPIGWLRTGAIGCPVPVVVNGTPLQLAPHNALGAPLLHPVDLADPTGRFHGTIGLQERGESRLLVLRDGVLASTRKPGPASLHIGGWVRCDGLELDASRSNITENDLWTDVQAAVLTAMRESFAHWLYDGAFTREDRLAAIELLAGLDCPLAHIPLFVSLDHSRNWSLAELARAPRVLVTGHTDLYDPGLDLPQLEGNTKDLHHLDSLLPGKVVLGTRELRERHAGRKRRVQLQVHAVPLDVAAVHTRTIEEDGLRMCVGIGVDGADWEGVRVEFRVDGLTVQTRTIANSEASPALVRVESEQLEAATDWSTVRPSDVRKALETQAVQFAEDTLPEAIRTHPNHPAVRAVAHTWLHRATRKRTRYNRLPDAIRALPLFSTGHGTHLGIDDIVRICRETGRKDDRGRPVVWVVPASERAPDPADQVLHVDDADLDILMRAFGGRVQQVGRRLADQRIARARRDAARATPKPLSLDRLKLGPIPVHEPLDQSDHGLRGTIGLRHNSDDSTPCLVVRDGVELGRLDLPAHLPGGVAVVEWDAAEPTDDWTALADPDTAAIRLAELLEPCFVDLASRTALDQPDLHRVPPAWWEALLARGPRVASELSSIPFVRSADGTVHTLADLVQHKAKGRSAGKVRWVPLHTTVPNVVADRYLVATPAHVAIMQAWLGKKWVVAGRDTVRDLIRQQERFFQSPVRPWTLAPDVVAELTVEIDGFTILIGLDGGETASPGLVVDVHYNQRSLERVHRRADLPWRAVVRGAAVRPSVSFKSLVNADLTRTIVEAVKQARVRVLDQLTTVTTGTAHHHRVRRRTWVLLDKRPRWLAAAHRNRIRSALTQRPMVEDAEGGTHTVPQLRVAAQQDRLRVLRKDPGLVPMPHNTLWIVAVGRDRDFLAAVAGKVPPSADRMVEELREGAERRASLAPEPLRPKGHYPLQYTVPLKSGGKAWIGLTPGRPGRRTLRVDGRPVRTEDVREARGFRIMVEHPNITANRTFTGWEDTDLARRTRSETIDAIGPLLEQGLSISKRLGGAADSVVDAALHFRSSGGRVNVEQAVLDVSHGPARTFSELAAIARRGPIRFAPAGTRGRPLDDAQPVFVGSPTRREALATWGKVHDAEADLRRESAVWARRTGPRFPLNTPSDTLFSVDPTAPFAGRLWVTTLGSARVTTLLDGRALESRPSGGPLPIVGHITHTDLEADRWFERARPDALRARLAGAVLQASETALGTLLDREDTPEAFLQQVILRAFNGKKAVRSPSGARKRLAERPLFRASGGQVLSAHDIASRPRTVRWVEGTHTFQSLDPDQPFVTVAEGLAEGFGKLLGGTDHTAKAAFEHRAAVRIEAHTRPFELPAGDWVGTEEGRHKGHRWKMGLAEDWTFQGRVDLRFRGWTVAKARTHLRGTVTILELDPATVDLASPPQAVPAALEKPLLRTFRALLTGVGANLVDGDQRARRFARTIAGHFQGVRKRRLPPKSHPMHPWFHVPVMEGVDRAFSVAELHGMVNKDWLVWVFPDSGPQPNGSVALRSTPSTRAIVDILGWDDHIQSPARWKADRKRRTKGRSKAPVFDAQKAARERIKPDVVAFATATDTTDLVGSALSVRDLPAVDTLDDPTTRLLLAWRLLDDAVARRDQPHTVVRLATHLARRLAELQS